MGNIIVFVIGFLFVFFVGYLVNKTRNRSNDNPVGGLPDPEERPNSGSKK